jgi:putative ABC transport system permease protein
MFFTTRQRFAELTGESRSSLVLATIPNYSTERVKAAADLIQRELEKQNREVKPAVPAPGGFTVRTSHPDRFIAQDALDGVFLMLTVMAVATLVLGLLLVYNTINAIVTQQVGQIGVMKAIGAGFYQILLIYFSTVFVYGLLALLLAIPLGAIGAYGIRLGLIGRIKMIPGPFQISTTAMTVQASIALLAPLLISVVPIFSGARITVREAISTYGLGGAGGWLERALNRAKHLPRTISLTIANTFRNKKRVALTQLTLIGAGVIFMMVTSTRTSLVHTFSDVLFSIFDSNIMLELKDVARIQEIENLALTNPEVTTVEVWNTAQATARLQGQPEANDDSPVKLRGIPLPSQTYQPKLRAGRWLEPGDTYSIVLNQELAEEIGVGVNEWLTLDIPTKRESNWLVVGLLFEPVDQDAAVVPRETLMKEMRQIGQGQAIRIQIAHDRAETEATTVAQLRDLYESRGYAVQASSMDTAHRMIAQRTQQMSILIALLSAMAIMIAVVGAIALSGTLSINVLERTREIGVMRAIGASSLVVAGQFVGEGLILGWLSWLLSIPLSIPVGVFVVGILSNLINIDIVYQFSTNGVLVWLIVITILSIIASWFPAQKAAQTSVRESLMYA